MHRIARALAILGSATTLATAPSAKGEPHEFTLAGDANLVFDPARRTRARSRWREARLPRAGALEGIVGDGPGLETIEMSKGGAFGGGARQRLGQDPSARAAHGCE